MSNEHLCPTQGTFILQKPVFKNFIDYFLKLPPQIGARILTLALDKDNYHIIWQIIDNHRITPLGDNTVIVEFLLEHIYKTFTSNVFLKEALTATIPCTGLTNISEQFSCVSVLEPHVILKIDLMKLQSCHLGHPIFEDLKSRILLAQLALNLTSDTIYLALDLTCTRSSKRQLPYCDECEITYTIIRIGNSNILDYSGNLVHALCQCDPEEFFAERLEPLMIEKLSHLANMATFQEREDLWQRSRATDFYEQPKNIHF